MGEIIRLQKYISMSGAASRRGAESLIESGRVKVNGKKITEQGVKVEVGADTVTLDGEILRPITKKLYIMLNKPVGYITSVKDQFDRPTVTELVKKDIDSRIYPVGRLDYDTSGLLILTNDGEFTQRVSHPKYETSKTYIASLKGGITVTGLNKLRRGVVLDDGFRTSPAEVEILDAVSGRTEVKITIHEGRNRQVRRMFDAVGSKVAELHRISIGTVELGNLPVGRWRHLTSHEISYLMNK